MPRVGDKKSFYRIRALNNNIIAPTIVNGITITVMAVIGFTAVVLIAQLFHLGVNMGGGSSS